MVDWACKNSSINKSINHILCHLLKEVTLSSDNMGVMLKIVSSSLRWRYKQENKKDSDLLNKEK